VECNKMKEKIKDLIISSPYMYHSFRKNWLLPDNFD
jgi:hypothetical protein